MVRILGREHIIRNIRPDILRVILPFDRGRHALHLTDNLALCQNLACVRITLDVILSTLPSPLCAPFDAGAGGAVKVGALRAGGCGVLAPEVVKDFVAGFGVVGVE
jgi:hypothetical protein